MLTKYQENQWQQATNQNQVESKNIVHILTHEKHSYYSAQNSYLCKPILAIKPLIISAGIIGLGCFLMGALIFGRSTPEQQQLDQLQEQLKEALELNEQIRACVLGSG